LPSLKPKNFRVKSRTSSKVIPAKQPASIFWIADFGFYDIDNYGTKSNSVDALT
jgi:hypothetical protein